MATKTKQRARRRVTVNQQTTQASAEQGKRLEDLRADRARCQATIEEVQRAAHGASGPDRKAAARTLTEAGAELSLIDSEIDAIAKELPGVVLAEAEAAAGAWVRRTVEQLRREGIPAILAAKDAAATAVGHAVVKVAEEDTARRDASAALLGIQVVGIRFPALDTGGALDGLSLPTASDHARPLLDAVSALGEGVRPWRGPVIPHGAADTPEQVQAAAWKALSGWLDKHAGSLPEEVRAIFAQAPVPDWENAEQKTKREAEAQTRAEEDRRLRLAFGGEAARAQGRRGL